MPHLQIEIHVLHPSPSAESKAKGYLLPDFYSGATGLPGRFSEGLSLRRLQSRLAQIPRRFGLDAKEPATPNKIVPGREGEYRAPIFTT
jgi:hypothetical protein